MAPPMKRDFRLIIYSRYVFLMCLTLQYEIVGICKVDDWLQVKKSLHDICNGQITELPSIHLIDGFACKMGLII